MRRASSILTLILTTVLLYGQTADDALRYSRVFYSGTSRFNGLSGAFGAVGADFSTLATNPAGIGLYRASEITLTIAPTIAYSSSVYNGTKASDNEVSFGMGNFGIVFSMNTTDKNNPGPLKSINVGFGFNRQNDFNGRIFINGVNTQNSLMQSYANTLNANHTPPEYVMDDYPFDIGLAYATNLVFHDSATDRYYCDAEYGGVIQNKEIHTYGSMNELDISVGANIADRLFVGVTFGAPFINYYESSRYSEVRTSDTIPNFISLDYWYDLRTRGQGFNFKVGLIYKPADWFRIGASVHTPTWYPFMTDTWSSSMQSAFTNTQWDAYQDSPLGSYDYRLTTPFRAMGSLAFIIGKYGLLSADYEYVNYSQARFNSTYDSFDQVNDDIRTEFRSWGNIRFGTEWRLSNFRLRGGFAYYSNPFENNVNDYERYQASGGFGYRAKHFFADVTYSWSKMDQDYYLYDASMVSPARIASYTHTVLTTVGVRF